MTNVLLGSNISEGAIVALKMMGGVAAAAVLLYLVLVLSRVLGTKIEEKKYLSYCEKYRAEHESDEGMLSKEQYIETRAKAGAVVWKRDDKTPKVIAEAPAVPPAEVDDNTAEFTPTEDTKPTEEDH